MKYLVFVALLFLSCVVLIQAETHDEALPVKKTSKTTFQPISVGLLPPPRFLPRPRPALQIYLPSLYIDVATFHPYNRYRYCFKLKCKGKIHKLLFFSTPPPTSLFLFCLPPAV
jgi:hypothetical protein